MTHPTNTEKVTLELDRYLKDNEYFNNNETAISQGIMASWGAKFRQAIADDIKGKFEGMEVDIVFSEFELASDDNQGACVFYHRAVIIDRVTLEFLKVSIKTLVNHNKTSIYLDSMYANGDEWTGKSKQLKLIFDTLKDADIKEGYFNPITLKALVRD
jgi:hypothetical protein